MARLLPHFHSNNTEVDQRKHKLFPPVKFTHKSGILVSFAAQLKSECIYLMGQLEMCGSSWEIKWEADMEAAGRGLKKESNWY